MNKIKTKKNTVQKDVNIAFDAIYQHFPSGINTTRGTDNSLKRKLERMVKEFEIEKILHAIDISASRYLPSYESKKLSDYELFLDKISGIAFNISKPPIQQKIELLARIASKRYRVDAWEIKQLLGMYVNTFSKYKDAEPFIINDLQYNILPKVILRNEEYYDFIEDLMEWERMVSAKIKERNPKLSEDE